MMRMYYRIIIANFYDDKVKLLDYLGGLRMDERELKILIIGNDLTDLNKFSEIISKALPTSNISVATNGLQGIELARANDPDIIIIDVYVSKEEALEISQIIKKEEALQATPMLFITDLEEDRDFRKEAFNIGAEGFVIKPIEDTILISQLKAMAKIKERNILMATQKEKLEILVEARTKDLRQEISERKRLEIELRSSEDKFRSYIKEAPIGILVIDALGRYIDVNKKACEMMGQTKKELLELSVADHLGSGQSEKGLEAFKNLTTQGFIFGEFKVTSKNNEEFWIELYGTRINENCFLTFYIDISERKFSELEIRKMSQKQSMMSEELAIKNKELSTRLQQTIKTISKIGEMKDSYTAGHQKKVGDLACAIAREMKLPDDFIDNISIGALIHDIGKINIPSAILNKPGKISNLEYQILQSHVDNSYEIVKEIDFPQEIIKMIYQHHERLDGTGYPNKLVGEEILMESRILAVADVVEAMMSHRPYRPALGIKAAIDEITKHRGIKYDSKVVDACIKIFKELDFTFPE